MGFFSNLFNDIFDGGSNAPEAAMPYYKKIPGEINRDIGPWINRGNQAYGQYSNKLNQLLNDPTGFINNIMGQYHSSPMYHDQMQAATTAANNAAAAGGTLGTGAEQSQLMSKANQLTDQDQQQYLQNVMSAFMPGLQGMGSLTNLGAQMSDQKLKDMIQNYQDEAGLQYQQQEDEDRGAGGLFSSIMGLL